MDFFPDPLGLKMMMDFLDIHGRLMIGKAITHCKKEKADLWQIAQVAVLRFRLKRNMWKGSHPPRIIVSFSPIMSLLVIWGIRRRNWWPGIGSLRTRMERQKK